MLTPGSRSSVRKIFKFCQHNGQACIKEAALHTSCIIRLRISWGIKIRKSRHFIIITMARLMLLLLVIAPLILTSKAESGQKVIQFKILRFHQDSFSLTFPRLNVVPLIFALNILFYGVLWAIDAYASFTRRSQRSKIWLEWCVRKTWPLKFLYGKGVVAWMRGFSAGRRHFRFAKVALYK